MKLTCYIIDDEPLAIEVLESHIGQFKELDLKGSFQNPVEAFQKLHTEPVDLLFLDIEMPELTGIEFIKSLQNPPLVIFTTAYRNFALTGFELDAVDYLLKPVTFNRFLKAISKVLRMKQLRPADIAGSNNEFLHIQAAKKTYQIPFEDIVYVESQRNKLKIVTTRTTLEIYETLTVMEDMLTNKGFLRVHRSFIIALDKLTGWSCNEVMLAEHAIPIGRSFASAVKNRLNTGVK